MPTVPGAVAPDRGHRARVFRGAVRRPEGAGRERAQRARPAEGDDALKAGRAVRRRRRASRIRACPGQAPARRAVMDARALRR